LNETYGRDLVSDSRDGGVATDALAALVGDLGLDHTDRLAGTFNGVVGRAATDNVPL